MSRIKEVKTVDIGRSAYGTNYAKGDYIKTEREYVVNTEDGRQCAVKRSGIVEMLAEIGIKVAVRITKQMLVQLCGHTLNESLVDEEGPRLNRRK